MDMDVYDAVGLLGVVFALYCYGRVQWQRNYARRFSYSFFNLAAAVCLIVSLMHEWNLSAFIFSAAWGLASMYGIYRCYRYLQRENGVRV